MTTSEKHVQTSPISTEKSPEMAWVDKVNNRNVNENYIYERFKHKIVLFFFISECLILNLLPILDGH